MSHIATDPSHGLRVLVAEDNLLIGEFIRQVLVDLEFTVVGPATGLDEALRAIRTGELDGALLDVQLGHENVFPAASELAQRGVPFILTTGRANLSGLPELLAGAPQLTKPFNVARLEEMVRTTFVPRRRTPPQS
jgi:DNA-binding response OmpR family regulator